MGLKPICNHSDMWNCWYEYNYSLPIYFTFCMHDTHFWCAVTFVCVVWVLLVCIGDVSQWHKCIYGTSTHGHI